MNIQEFEKHIHTSLHNKTAPVDEAALFQALGIEEEKNRTYLIPVLCVGLALAIIGGVYWAKNTTNASNSIPTTMTEEAEKHPSNSIHEIVTATNEKHRENAPSSTPIEEQSTLLPTQLDESDNTYTKPAYHTKKQDQNPSQPEKNVLPAYTLNSTARDVVYPPIHKESNKALVEGSTASINHRVELSEVQALTTVASELLHDRQKLVSSKKIECPRFTPPDVVLRVGVEASLGGTHKTLAMRTPETNEVFEHRKNNENALENIGLKVFTEIESRKLPVGLKVGAEFTRYVEKMRYKDSFVQIDTTVGIISQTVSPNGDTITTIYGDIVTETEITVDKVRHFSLFTLDVPVTATYELPVGKSSGIQLELGASLNFRMWKRGSMLTDMNTFTPVKEANYFRNALGISMIGQVNYRRSLWGGIAYMGVGVRYIPTSLSLGSTYTDHNYTSMGLKMGYIMSF